MRARIVRERPPRVVRIPRHYRTRAKDRKILEAGT